MLINNNIPDISKQIYEKDLLNILEKKYSILGPIWVTSQMEWMNGIYASFKNHDKFLIIIYLLKKTLDIYSRNFIKLTYDEFYKKDSVEIEHFNVTEISKELNIPKESARRKINELQDIGAILRSGKRIIIDRSSFQYVKPINALKRISRFLSLLSKESAEEEILLHKLSSEHLETIIKNNFSFIWKNYYELQIPMMLTYKKIFKDLETFHIFGTCVVNQHLQYHNLDDPKINREDFIESIVSQKIQGINAMSISDITGIPRATVIRKLQNLVLRKNLTIDNKKHYRLSGSFTNKIKTPQKVVLNHLANFSTKVFNFSIL
jgi:hypothetical protein